MPRKSSDEHTLSLVRAHEQGGDRVVHADLAFDHGGNSLTDRHVDKMLAGKAAQDRGSGHALGDAVAGGEDGGQRLALAKREAAAHVARGFRRTGQHEITKA